MAAESLALSPGPGEKAARRARLVASGALIGVVITLGWWISHLATGWPGAWANGVALAGYGLVYAANRAGRHRLAGHALIIVANLHLLLLSKLAFAASTGAYRWYMLVALGAFLVLGEKDRRARAVHAAISVTLLTAIELGYFATPSATTGLAEFLLAGRVVNSVSIALALLFLVQRFVRDISRAEAEKEVLLLNILPPTVAARLRAGASGIADGHEQVSVLFADIVGFTRLAEKVPAADLVLLLGEVFSGFDEAADEVGAEKIKTIGDAYMAAAGIPLPHPDGAGALAQLALRMQQVVAEVSARSGHPLQIRIGIHTGPVVAGVIGKRKFSYDLWGDTVNVAARMESHGVPGDVQVSRQTRELLRDRYAFEARGPIEIKGKGPLEVFLLRGPVGPPR